MATTTKTEARGTVASWIPVSLVRELRTRAAEGDRTVSAEVRRALARHLKATANQERSAGRLAIEIPDEQKSGEVLAAGATNATQAATKSREPITVVRYEC